MGNIKTKHVYYHFTISYRFFLGASMSAMEF